MASERKKDPDKYPHWKVGERLRAIRSTTGMSAKDFAARYGFNYTRYINWESGHRRIMPEDAEVICEKVGVTMDFIYRGIEAQLPHNIAMALSSNPRLKAINTSSETPD